MSPRVRACIVPGVFVAVILAAAVALVVASLRRPELPAYAPTPPAPAEVGTRLVGPAVYTVDATSHDGWRYFDFSRGSTVERPGPLDWDLAFRRNRIIANGGPGFAGGGGILDLGPVPFDSAGIVPDSGYAGTVAGRDTVNPAMERWYRYNFLTHVLTPKPHVYAVRTADARYAKLQILGYYCPGAVAGCLTFRYVYQGDGSRRMAR